MMLRETMHNERLCENACCLLTYAAEAAKETDERKGGLRVGKGPNSLSDGYRGQGLMANPWQPNGWMKDVMT